MKHLTEQDFNIHAKEVFQPHEFTEVLILVYRFISKAVVYKHSDTLTITATHFSWSRQGKLVSEFPIESHPYQRVSFREAFDLIMARDPFARQFFHHVSSEPDRQIYRVITE